MDTNGEEIALVGNVRFIPWDATVGYPAIWSRI